MIHLQSSHSSDRESSDTIWNQATESEIVHINSNLCELCESIVSIQQCIHELKKELTLQKQLARLKQQTCSDHTTLMLCQRPSSSPKGTPVQKWQWPAAFMLQSSDLQLYYSRIMQKYWDWFCDAEDAIKTSILYFSDDIVKVQYALHYITAKPKVAWREYSKIIPKNNWTWVGFKQFLLNCIEDSQNQHLIISKHYTEAKQKSEQKTSDFVNYLTNLKYDFKKLLKSMHHNNFLNKMQKKLYDKIIVN